MNNGNYLGNVESNFWNSQKYQHYFLEKMDWLIAILLVLVFLRVFLNPLANFAKGRKKKGMNEYLRCGFFLYVWRAIPPLELERIAEGHITF